MSDNRKRRLDAMHTLEKQINARERSERFKPLGVISAAAVAILLIVGGIVYATNYSSKEEPTDVASPTTAPTPDTQPLTLKRATALEETVTCKYDKSSSPAAREVSVPKTDKVSTTGTVKVTLSTNKGDIDMDLDRSVSPCTVNAIEHLAKEGYYDNTVCHRLTTAGISVLQCGDPSGTGGGDPGFMFKNEYPTDETTGEQLNQPVTYPRGSIAMANSGADTNGSQFFLNYADSPLPPTYTYFGQVSEAGLAVLDKIAAAGVEGGAPDGPPAEEVKIEKATVA